MMTIQMLTWRRFASTVGRSKINHHEIVQTIRHRDTLKLSIDQNGTQKELLIPFIWLRDHCRSPKCFNYATQQRKNHMKDISKQSSIEEVSVKNNEEVELKWSDDHVSTFNLDFILENSLKKVARKVENYLNLWNSSLKTLPVVEKSTITFETFSKKLFSHGFVIVDGVESTPEATNSLCSELIPIHDTFFGAFWTFSNDSSKDTVVHEDTAYGNVGIGPHTDGTYFNQTPGIQVFHCLKAAEKGGDTILVDALQCAITLKKQNPEYFDLLTKFKIEHNYLEGDPVGSEIYSRSSPSPIIQLDEYGSIQQIRFNPLDRSPMRCLSFGKEPKEVIEFYKAYEAFAKICTDEKNFVQISLEPGKVIFIDNFRVLHARTEFEGYRQMCGCYLSRDNFMAKARPFLSKEIRDFV